MKERKKRWKSRIPSGRLLKGGGRRGGEERGSAVFTCPSVVGCIKVVGRDQQSRYRDPGFPHRSLAAG